jgi:hypothetical protein
VAEASEVQGFDPSVPSPARIWNYYIGGKDNYAADRAVAERVFEVLPTAPLVAQMTRRFLVRVVRELAVGYGIRQFLDIGSGLPTADNTHQVAQRVAPSSRVGSCGGSWTRYRRDRSWSWRMARWTSIPRSKRSS